MYYLSFKIAHQWYGIAIHAVIEVLQLVYLTEIPGVKTEVLGLMTLRETVVPVIDLRTHFNLPPAQLSLSTPIIAIQNGEQAIGLVVDEVDDVLEIPDDACLESHESLYVKHVASLDDRLIMLLDTSFLTTNLYLVEKVSI